MKDKIRRLFEKNPQLIGKLPEYFSQIESKAVARISSSLGQQLGINIPIADQEGKSGQYWERVRDIAKLGREKCETFRDPLELIEFLEQTQNKLSEVYPDERKKSPLEEILGAIAVEILEKEQALQFEPEIFGHLTPYIYTRKSAKLDKVILESTKGEIGLDTTELKKVILRLELIYELIGNPWIKIKTDEEETRLLRILKSIRKWKQENTVEFKSWNLGEQYEFRRKLWEKYTREEKKDE